MVIPSFTRRSVLGAAALLGPLLRSSQAMPSDPIFAAIRRAEAADEAHRLSGLISLQIQAAGARPSSEWMAHRAALTEARSVARMSLHEMTPASPKAADALVSYYAARAARTQARGAVRAARRRLRVDKAFSSAAPRSLRSEDRRLPEWKDAVPRRGSED
jgi:hypothetical protein